MFFKKKREYRKFIRRCNKQEFEHYILYEYPSSESHIKLYVTRKKAGKGTHIHCAEDGTVFWEQFYPFGGMSNPQVEKHCIMKPQVEASTIAIVLIRGTPSIVLGLDAFVIKSYVSEPKEGNVYLATGI